MKEFQTLDEEGRKKRIKEMNEWCKVNAGRTSADLVFDSLRSVEDWPSFANAAAECVREKVKDSIPLILQRASSFPDHEQDIAEMLYLEDAPELLPAARVWLNSEKDALRFYGSLILFRIGDRSKNEGFAELSIALASDDGSVLYPRAIDPLLARGDESSISLAADILKKSGFSPGLSEVEIINRLLRTGRQEVLDYLFSNIDSKDDARPQTGEWKGQQVTRTITSGDHFSSLLELLHTDKWTYDMFAPDADRAKKRGDLKELLAKQVKLVRTGKPTTLRAIEPLYFSRWQLDAP